jgi:hypothetical protein
MTTQATPEALLPPYTLPRAPCRQCGRRTRIMVMFDRDCREASGDHYHRRCLACDGHWVERCAPAGPSVMRT